jgi:hypothetical protein
MQDPPGKIFKYNEDLTKKIFSAKENLHRELAMLPIEEKIRILVELQKIALTIRPAKGPNDPRMVWKIDR